MQRPSYPTRNFRNKKLRFSAVFNIDGDPMVDMRGFKTLQVNQEKDDSKTKGYAFPYIDPSIKKTKTMKFALLKREDAQALIRLKELRWEQHNHMLRSYAIRNVKVKICRLDDNGLVLEEPDSFEDALNNAGDKKTKEGKVLWERNGSCHGAWMKTDTIDICDWDMLQFVLHSVYKDFGFPRNVSDCFGLNVYTGKRGADYIRPSPKMSDAIISKTEYYRQEFNPTFHPLVYKMVNDLTVQATSFQKKLDPIYDRFLIESYYHDLCSELDENEKGTTDENHSLNKKVPRRKPPKGNRRSCRLSILTGGNVETSGFANVGHKDGDLCDPDIQVAALEVITKICDHRNCQNEMHKKIITYLKKIHSKCDNFHVYTTCGYKMLLKNKKKTVFAFFYYNSLKVAVMIPEDSCYHSFFGSIGTHQTSFLVTFDGEIIRYNDNNLHILA